MITHLTKYNYRGIHTGTGEPNHITKIIYKAKLLNSKVHTFVLANIMFNQLKNINIDLLIHCEPTKAKNNLPGRLAYELALKLNIPFISINYVNLKAIQNKNVLIIDDVITTGKTMNKAIEIVNYFAPKNIYTLAAAITKNAILNTS